MKVKALFKLCVTALGGIALLSSSVVELITGIAGQIAAAQEIARNVEQAAAGTHKVSGNITLVTSAAADAGTVAAKVLDASQGMTAQSETLLAEVDHFVNRVRAA